MEEKKKITISISTLCLIIAIIAICVMGYIIYKLNGEKTTAIEQVSELNSKSTQIENAKTYPKEEVTSSAKTTNEISKNNAENSIDYIKKNISVSDVVGTYKWQNNDNNGVELILAEDGTFNYSFEVGGITGNYTISDNNIILNEVFAHGGSTGLVVIKGKKSLTINKDNSITGNFSNEDYSYVPSSITMKKTSNSNINSFDIREQMKSSLGADWNNSYLTFNY